MLSGIRASISEAYQQHTYLIDALDELTKHERTSIRVSAKRNYNKFLNMYLDEDPGCSKSELKNERQISKRNITSAF